jgi:hypothetical protein
MPEWWLLLGVLGFLGLLGLWWFPLLFALPLLVMALAVTLAEAGLSAHASWRGRRCHLGVRALTASLYVLQPLARLMGRLSYGLTPWRRNGVSGFLVPRPRELKVWSEQWHSAEDRLEAILKSIQARFVVPVRGGDYDRWDLECRGGILGGARLRHTVEEHGAGRQLVRYRVWPRVSRFGLGLPLLLGLLGALALHDGAGPVALGLGVFAAALGGHALWECGCASGAIVRAAGAHRVAEVEPAESGRVREAQRPESESVGVHS